MACLLAHYWASTTSCVWGRSANKNTSSSYCWSVHAHCRRFDRLLGVRMCTHEIWIHTMTTSLLYIPLSSGLLPSPSLFSVLPCHTACIAWAKPSCSCTEMCFLSYLLLCWNVSSCMIMSRHYNNLTCELIRLLAIAQVLIKIARTCNIHIQELSPPTTDSTQQREHIMTSHMTFITWMYIAATDQTIPSNGTRKWVWVWGYYPPSYLLHW